MSSGMTGVDRPTTPLLRDRAGESRVSTSDETSAPRSSIGPATVVELSASAKAVSPIASASKDFATVATDARAALDAGYTKAGKTSSIYTTGAEWRELFSGLDRRALYAIKSNEGGKFSDLERDIANTEMIDRLQADTGLDALNSFSKFAPTWKKAVTYLDNVSNEEKGSLDWAKQRAGMQFNYELSSRNEGEEPEKLDSTNPTVKLIKAALDSLKALNDPSNRLEDMPLYKQAEQLFASQQAGASTSIDIEA